MPKSPRNPLEPKGVIVVREGCAVSEEHVQKLLSDAGLDLADFAIEDDDSCLTELDPTDLPVVVVIDETVCDDEELEVIARRFASAGASIIAVFARQFEYEGMHPIAEKYGTQCAWSPMELAEKIKNPQQSAPTDTTGSHVERARAKQVNC